MSNETTTDDDTNAYEQEIYAAGEKAERKRVLAIVDRYMEGWSTARGTGPTVRHVINNLRAAIDADATAALETGNPNRRAKASGRTVDLWTEEESPDAD